jgi:predicted O-linked N-acetylglucosamine transferase (SPINDLY family)
MEVWTRILQSVPASHLILKAKSLSESATRDDLLQLFAERGIASERIELLSWKSSTREHLSNYNRIDIGLDTFPYNGTTTTCEALWMGVPVITLTGNTHASRVGTSLLLNIGLPQLVARTHDEYVEIALALAADLQWLQSIREGMRAKMQQSPLCDGNRFTFVLEKHFRGMWHRWCESL